MASSNIIMKHVVSVLLLLLALFLSPVDSFHVNKNKTNTSSLATSSSSSSSSKQNDKKATSNKNNNVVVGMGGYYNEPEDTAATKNDQMKDTHMIFGVRCVQYTTYCSMETSVVNLGPVEGRQTDTTALSQQYLVKYLLTPDDGTDDYRKPELKGKRIVQIGTGSAALACAKYSGASEVVVVDNDETRLKIFQHAHDVLNKDNTSPGVSCPLETMFLEPKDALPKADVIILSTEDEDWIAAALDQDRTRTVLFEGAY